MQRLFAFPDIHWGRRDPRAVDVALQAWAKFKPDLTIVGGDLIDAGPLTLKYGVQCEDEDDNYDLLRGELEPARDFLTHLASRSPVVFLEGNHDIRVERWAASQSRRAFDALVPRRFFGTVRGLTYKRFTGNDRRGQHYQITPRLITIHGWTTGKTAMDKHLDKAAPLSVLHFHDHHLGMKVRRLYDGTSQVVVNAGCLCELEPFYAHNGSPLGWSHGFVEGYYDNKNHHLFPVEITRDYRAVTPDGREFRG